MTNYVTLELLYVLLMLAYYRKYIMLVLCENYACSCLVWSTNMLTYSHWISIDDVPLFSCSSNILITT